MTALLAAHAVRKTYGGFVALDDVSLAVAEGEFISIVGPNGAGKTTLVNVLTGLLTLSSGEIRFKGRDIAGIGPVRLAKLGMARAFQLVNIFPTLTVRETLSVAIISQRGRARSFFARLDGDREILARVREVAKIFGLDGKLDHVAGTLPQGAKKLLDVASAFALQPEVILLDEPTSGVSTREKAPIMDRITGVVRSEKISAVIIEHDMDVVFKYSDRIVVMHQGTILADGTPEAIRRNDTVITTLIGTATSS
jgi:branched-chain amino acid transport system ATP-binding protein